jgi:hypothetical protein
MASKTQAPSDIPAVDDVTPEFDDVTPTDMAPEFDDMAPAFDDVEMAVDEGPVFLCTKHATYFPSESAELPYEAFRHDADTFKPQSWCRRCENEHKREYSQRQKGRPQGERRATARAGYQRQLDDLQRQGKGNSPKAKQFRLLIEKADQA